MRSKKSPTPCLRPQRRPIWKRKGDIPMAQIYDEVLASHPNRLQSKFRDFFSENIANNQVITVPK